MKIYNTLSQKKEEFVPLVPNEVKMYLCGPTVYDLLHVGNFRGAIFFNLVRNWLESKGWKVTFVYNYTDIDDKIINRANAEGKETKDVAEKYIEEFEKDFSRLGLKKHTHNPRATHFIDGMIKIISGLIDQGKAYVAPDGEVIYSVESFSEYGKLSHKNLEDLQSGSRVEVSSKKKNPLDFTLWKPSKPGEPTWDSPWTKGRPGWHIECSAMSSEILGDTIDIHGGGIDLIFPHHENEIAQSEGCSGKPFVRYWMHNNFINMGSEKMSKSLGNIVTGRGFMEKYHPEILKYMILMAHYRSQSDFSIKQIRNAIAGLARFYAALALAEEGVKAQVDSAETPKKFLAVIEESKKKIQESLDDDFNTPEVLASLFEVVRQYNTRHRKGQTVNSEIKATAIAFQKYLSEVGALMALFQEPAKDFLRFLDEMLIEQKGIDRALVDKLVIDRRKARDEKDFATSDKIRDQLNQMEIEVHDTPQGSTWEVRK
jgi:cysteinyl-tRNA synthetase